jgi:naphthalene 1,2-dioxygenase ferredoxin reductase component
VMAYLAGPPVMVEAASALLRSHGVAPRQIHADAFYNQN